MTTILQRCASPDLRGDYLSRPFTLPGAILSDDSMRRYLLWRFWGDPRNEQAKWMLFVMLNPSTADGRSDDPTIRKCREFARRAGCDGFEVVNLISQRSPKPGVVRAESEPKEADEIISLALARCELVVVAWGALSGLSKPARKIALERIDAIREFASYGCRTLKCLSVTQNGQPGHPLFIPYSATLQEWKDVRDG